jgi:hypothetical protein
MSTGREILCAQRVGDAAVFTPQTGIPARTRETVMVSVGDGSAVHYIARGSYGYPQSLGCVELPYSAAAAAYPYLPYGTLVTVTP